MQRPNVLLLYTDQQRFDALGVVNPRVSTPNLDRLAAEGLCFTHCVVQNPVCMPSRASFLTNRYPSELGIYDNGVPLPQELTTAPHVFARCGYTTANMGKLHFLPHANRDHRTLHPDYGFTHLEISDEPGCYPDAYYEWVRQRDPQALDLISCGLPPAAQSWRRVIPTDDSVVHPPERFPKEPIPFRADSALTHTAFVADRVRELIRTHTDRPFLAIGGFYSPHSPWIAPQEFIGQYNLADMPVPRFPEDIGRQRDADHYSDDELRKAHQGYWAMVSEVDHHVGSILEELDRQGLADDTIVVFTSDHGELLGDHLRYGKGAPGWDACSRVPLIVRWPHGIRNPGQRVDGIVEAIDVIPTLLRACAIPVPPEFHGQPLDLSAEKIDTGRSSALTEMRDCRALRTRRFRYTLFRDGRETLHDYQNDLPEYTDVSDEPGYSEVLGQLRLALARRQLINARPRPRAWAY